MDKLRNKFARKYNERATEEIPTIVVDSPPEEINLPYIDQTPLASGEDTSAPSTSGISSANGKYGMPSKENNKEDDDKESNQESNPQSANGDVSKDGTSVPSSAGARRPSLRRNSVSLPNLEDLELQVLRDQHQRRIREVNFVRYFIIHCVHFGSLTLRISETV